MRNFDSPNVFIEVESKKGSVDRGRSRLMKVLDERPVNFGGVEGEKKRLIVQKEQMDASRSESREDPSVYISKRAGSRVAALKVVKEFAIARERGYKVPPETFYYSPNGEDHYVVSTDLSEHGNIPTWGINGNQTTYEIESLRRINPTREELENAILPLGRKMDADGCYSGKDVWLVRRNPNSGELEGYILDMGTMVLGDGVPRSDEHNCRRAQDFITYTLGKLADNE